MSNSELGVNGTREVPVQAGSGQSVPTEWNSGSAEDTSLEGLYRN